LIVAVAVVAGVVLAARWLGRSPAESGATGASPSSPDVTAVSPVVLWNQMFVGNSEQEFNGVAVFPDSGVVAVGETYSASGDLPMVSAAGVDSLATAPDAAVARFAPDGGIMWARAYGGNGKDYFSSVAVGADGSIFVVGWTGSTDGDFPVTRGDPPGSDSNAVIAKLTPLGDIVWEKTFGGRVVSFESVAWSPDGGVVVAGFTSGLNNDFPVTGASSGSWYGLLVKFSDDGVLEWWKTVDEVEGSLSSVVVAANGDIVAVGSTAQNSSHSDGGYGDGDAMVARFSGGGQLIRVNLYGGSGEDVFNSVVMATDGGIVAGGFTESTDGDFPMTHVPAGSRDGVVAHVGADGALIWGNTYGGNYGTTLYGLAPTPDGNVVAVGWMWGPFWGTASKQFGGAIKISNTGEVMWMTGLGGDVSFSFNAVAVTPTGAEVIAGSQWVPNDSPSDSSSTDGIVGALIVAMAN